MAFFYLLALIPLVAALALLAKNPNACWQECLGSAALAFALAGTFHYAAIKSQTGDHETWSGMIVKTTHFPQWVEQQMRTVTDYDSKGNATGSHIEYDYVTHWEHWTADTSTDDSHEINQSFFGESSGNFGGISTEHPWKSGFYSGDPNIYVAYDKTGFIYPTNEWRSFQNRLKAQPNLFQFSKIPQGVSVYDYPENKDWMHSDRLVGPIKSRVDPLEFDRLNARIGAIKKVNVILVGFKNRGIDAGQYQQSAWFGGRKNDLVLCFDAANAIPSWAFCFGWTEREDVKRNLESIAMTDGASTATLPKIEAEIQRNYTIKNWHKFDYISIPAPSWALIWMPIALLISQAAYWWWALSNEYRGEAQFV